MLIFGLWHFVAQMFRFSMFPKQLIDHTFVFLGLQGITNFPSSRLISKARILRISKAYLPFPSVDSLIQWITFSRDCFEAFCWSESMIIDDQPHEGL
jgi:hypothetical protein